MNKNIVAVVAIAIGLGLVYCLVFDSGTPCTVTIRYENEYHQFNVRIQSPLGLNYTWFVTGNTTMKTLPEGTYRISVWYYADQRDYKYRDIVLNNSITIDF